MITGYTIKEVSDKYGLSSSALRYYEQAGLIPSINKSSSGQREYSESDLQWIEIVICMRKTGMKISYIKRYVDLCHLGEDTVSERYQIFIEQKKIIEQQLKGLEANMDIVDHKINYYKTAMERSKNPINPLKRVSKVTQ